MNALQKDIITKKADVYKVSAAQAYGFATLLALDDTLKAIIRKECNRIGIQATEEQLQQVCLTDDAAKTIIHATCDIINDYSTEYKGQAVPEMQKELNDRGIYVRIGMK